MTCNCQITTQSNSGYTVIVPAGCLGDKQIELQCKSPQESVYYQFSLQNRLSPNEMITSVVAEASDGTNVVIDHITIANQYFKCRISGGNLNTLAGIRFLITTNINSVREFDVTLPILAAGVIKEESTGLNYVIGDKGGIGATGPEGMPGKDGVDGKDGATGETGAPGKDGTQILTSNRDPVNDDSGKNLVWLNMATGDLFETIPSGEQYIWNKVGNLKGSKGDKGDKGVDGSRIVTSHSDPDQSTALDNPNNIWLNTKSWEVWRTIPNQTGYEWINIGSIQGPKGDTGLQGPKGADGVTPTIVAGDTKTLSPGEAAQVKSTTTGATTVFDFSVPQGPKGDAGSRWYSGNEAPSEKTGLQDERGAPRPGDMYLHLDQTKHEAETYILTEEKNWAGPLATVAGPQGAPGVDGVTYSFNVGTVTSLDADSEPTIEYDVNDVTHVVTVNYGIPKGLKGDTGSQGIQGETGATGPQGESYANDGTVDLNVKSITSDGGNIKSDGNGNLNINNITGKTFNFNDILKLGDDYILTAYFIELISGLNTTGTITSSVVNVRQLNVLDDNGKTILAFNTGKVTGLNCIDIRKTLPDFYTPKEGDQGWDSTNKKPVWYDGTKWVDVMGNAV